jgi:hypothetical protein
MTLYQTVQCEASVINWPVLTVWSILVVMQQDVPVSGKLKLRVTLYL